MLRRMGKQKVDGASQEIDGVEPEVSGGSQGPMNGLGQKGRSPMRGLQSSDFLAAELGAPRVLLALDLSEMYMYIYVLGRPV